MEQRDEQLWRIARKRAGFQRSLVSYAVVNGLLWFIWWFSQGRHNTESYPFPWPVWPMIGWGIGLVYQYLEAYGGSRKDLVEKEYEKLKKQSDR